MINKTNKLVKHITEYKEANIVLGADVYISVEDAKSILVLTTMKTNDEGNLMLHKSRDLLRSIAKTVLFSSGRITSEENLLSKFSASYFSDVGKIPLK